MDTDKHYCTDYELCSTCELCEGGCCICIDDDAAETDCQCPAGDACPCEADADDGLCKCCRAPDGEHRGTCAGDALSTAKRKD